MNTPIDRRHGTTRAAARNPNRAPRTPNDRVEDDTPPWRPERGRDRHAAFRTSTG
jgi:hypothetical protein